MMWQDRLKLPSQLFTRGRASGQRGQGGQSCGSELPSPPRPGRGKCDATVIRGSLRLPGVGFVTPVSRGRDGGQGTQAGRRSRLGVRGSERRQSCCRPPPPPGLQEGTQTVYDTSLGPDVPCRPLPGPTCSSCCGINALLPGSRSSSVREHVDWPPEPELMLLRDGEQQAPGPSPRLAGLLFSPGGKE